MPRSHCKSGNAEARSRRIDSFRCYNVETFPLIKKLKDQTLLGSNTPRYAFQLVDGGIHLREGHVEELLAWTKLKHLSI